MFIKINGKSILERNLLNFKKLKASRVSIVTGYKSRYIKNFLINNRFSNIKLLYNKHYNKYGNSYSIMVGLTKHNYSKTLILDGDLVYDFYILKKFFLKNTNSILVGNGNINDIECAKVLINR